MQLYHCVCGAELNPDFSGCYINRRLRCDTEIEQPYYSKEYGPLLCIQCAKPLDAEGIRIILLKVSLGSLYVMTKELCTNILERPTVWPAEETTNVA